VKIYDALAASHEIAGTVQQYHGPANFIDLDGPLAMGMLINSKLTGEELFAAYDLVEFLRRSPKLSVKSEEVDGVECLTLATMTPAKTPNTIVYLDPARDFAVLGVETFIYTRGEEGGKTELYYRWMCEDLVNFGNGIWLPTKIVQEYYRTGPRRASESPRARRVTTVERLAVNKGVEDKLFTDVFPLGIRVWDAVHRLNYRLEPITSIEQEIDRVLETLE
jgi:hypothetical protein